jgi:hydrogenase nickel incorporation protein HypB
MLISKTDLLPHLDDFSPEHAKQHLHNLANNTAVIEFSAKNEAGLDEWIAWLQAEIAAYRLLVASQQTLRPKVQQDGQLLHVKPGNSEYVGLQKDATQPT